MEDVDTLVFVFGCFNFSGRKCAVFCQDARYTILSDGIISPLPVCFDFLKTEIRCFCSLFVYKSPQAIFNRAGRSFIEHSQVGQSYGVGNHLLAVPVQCAVNIAFQHADVAIVVIIQNLVVLTRYHQLTVLVLQSRLPGIIVHDNKSGLIHITVL